MIKDVVTGASSQDGTRVTANNNNIRLEKEVLVRSFIRAFFFFSDGTIFVVKQLSSRYKQRKSSTLE